MRSVKFINCTKEKMYIMNHLIQETRRTNRRHAFICTAITLIAMLQLGGISAQTEEEAFSELNWMEGPVTAKVGLLAEQKVPEGFVFLEEKDARKLLELTKNLSDNSDVGVIMPVDRSWWACYEYADCGYVSDSEKNSLDADEILKALKEGNREGNAERRRRGFPEMELIGWAVPPHYDEVTHNLEWATKLTSDEGGLVVNYNTRILGRGGVMSVILVCEPGELGAVLPQFKTALNGFDYRAGYRYREYRSGDPLADIGLTALIVGGAAAVGAKAGLFKSLWKFIVFIALAIGGFFKKLFGGKKQDQ